MKRTHVVLAAALGAALVMGCELIAGLEDRALVPVVADAGVDAPFEATTNPNFSLAVSPPNIVLEPNGPGVPVEVTITRLDGFSEAIAVSLSNPPAGISGSAIIPGNSSTGTLNVFANQNATVGQVLQATVLAQGTPSGVAATQPLGLRVGHLVLATNLPTTFVVPADVTTATLAVWGGGGGGGWSTVAGNQAGGAGGAGGFAEATFPVTPGETLDLRVATGGAGGLATSSAIGGGGSGGGYSAVLRASLVDGGVADASADAGDAGAPSPYLIVAGGGGGGGGGYYYPINPALSGPGKTGGDGSGGAGTAGAGSSSGKGATTTAGGAGGTACGSPQAGTSLQGGQANAANGDAGVPGGGRGGSSSGAGGGGGFYGGGAGGAGNTSCLGGGGGGGGSGHVEADGTSVTASAGTGVTPPSTNHKYYEAGVGAGGAAKAAGGGGRIVIYVP